MSFPLTYFKHPQWSCIVVNFDGCTVGFIVFGFPRFEVFRIETGKWEDESEETVFFLSEVIQYQS